MIKLPFSIPCPSCQSRLLVRQQELIGHILSCPKCGGMVLVEPPPETVLPPEPVSPENTQNSLETGEPVADHPPVEDHQAEPPEQERPVIKKETTGKSSRKILAGGVIVFLVLLCGAYLAGRYWPAESTIITAQPEDILPDPPPPVTAQPAVEDATTDHVEDIFEPDSSSAAQSDTETAAFDSISQPDPEPVSKEDVEETVSAIATQTTEETTEEPAEEPTEESTEAVTETNEGEGGIVILETPQDRANIIPAQEIDIAKQLAFPIKKISVPEVPLVDVVRVFSQLTAIPVKLDLDEMRARGLSVHTKVTFDLESTTGTGFLKAIEEAIGLVALNGPGYIVLTYPESEKKAIFEKHYDLSQLLNLENPFGKDQIIGWIKQMVTPEAWENENIKVEIRDKELVLSHNHQGHDQVERFVLMLHYMRDLEPVTDLTPEQIAPEAMGWDMLCRKTSFNYYEPTVLKEILGTLEKNRNIRILVDEETLFQVGLSQESKTTVMVDNGTINEILEQLLASLDLTYRIMEVDVLEITTLDAAGKHPVVELHRCPQLEENKKPEDLVKTMKTAFEPESWHDAGGGGAIVYDEASNLFLIRQNQPTQRKIRLWLGERNAFEAPSEPKPDDTDQTVSQIDRISVELDQENLDLYFASAPKQSFFDFQSVPLTDHFPPSEAPDQEIGENHEFHCAAGNEQDSFEPTPPRVRLNQPIRTGTLPVPYRVGSKN